MVMTAKAALRARLRRIRRGLEPGRRAEEQRLVDQGLHGLLQAIPAPAAVAAYLALPDECAVEAIFPVVWALAIPLLVPCTGEKRLTWHHLLPTTPLRLGALGIREPAEDRPAQPLPPGTLMLVPGVGFTAAGRRLGQGGGYYDQVLAHRPPGLIAVGVGFSCQCCPEIPVEDHDQPVDGVLLGQWVLRPPAYPDI